MRWPLLLLCLCLAGPAVAQEAISEPTAIWYFVDDAGQMHFVDRFELIPKKYRKSAQQTNLATEAQPAPAAAVAAPTPKPAATPTPTPTPTPEPVVDRLAEALAQQREAIEELTRLEEGWSAGDEPEEVLQARVQTLQARLTELEAEIAALRAR